MTEIALTRRQLWEAVWETPMKRLGEKYGVPPSEIARICERNAVPRPGPGHWPLVRKGFVMEREALPTDPPENTKIEIVESREPPPDEHPVVAAQIAYEKEHPIAVAEKLGRPHPLVAQARDSTRPRTPGSASALITQCNVLPIRVSAKQIPRALRLLDALFQAAEERGFVVQHSGEGRESRTKIEVHGESMDFRLEEPNRQTTHVLTAREQDEKRRGQGWSIPRYDYSPTGTFTFTIDEYAGGLQHRWSDGKRRRLEECVSEIIVAMVRIAVTVLLPRRLEWERQRAIRTEEEHRWLQQRAKVDALNRALPDFRRAQDLREFIDAVLNEARQANGTMAEGGPIAEWLAWARALADRTDPVRQFVRDLTISNRSA